MARILINSILLYLIYLIFGINGLISGTDIFITDFPFQVSIRLYDTHHLCGGCIISKWHVLTAASCVTSDVNVVFGNLKVFSETGDNNHGTLNDVAIVIIHPEYSPRNFWANDISILKLSQSLVSLPIEWPDSKVYHIYKFQIIGWIKLGEDDTRISKFFVKILSNRECNNYFRLHRCVQHAGQACIKPNSALDQIIEGDGGNPIITTKYKNLVGIVSLISIKPNFPSIITQIPTFYNNWMLSIVEKY